MSLARRRDYRWRWLALGLFVAVGLFAFLVGATGKREEDVEAASLANFNAGYIISDYQMGNYTSMTEAEIQAFLTAKNPCANTDENYYKRLSAGSSYTWHFENGHFVCLSEEKFGDGEVIGKGETAAYIIWQAAQDYKINPQALIVLLQKETGLITDPIPNNGDYRKATGYGCPDTVACSAKYYGFKNQVRNAAAMYRAVLDGGWTNYPIGRNYIQYSPNAACGGSYVEIKNLATSALYRYTPYQPNAAALAAGYGTATCGAYGNRNFYLYFQDWFGDPTTTDDNMTTNYVVERETQVTYAGHIQNIGWVNDVTEGNTLGTSGRSLQMEAVKIAISSKVTGLGKDTGITYRTYVQDAGGESAWVKDGAQSGTTGKSKRLEAIQVKLYGSLADTYDVYYRVHVQNIGWMGWAKNGETAGTVEKGLQIEALEVRLVEKSGVAPVSKNQATAEKSRPSDEEMAKATATVKYTAHVENVGWQNTVESGKTAGTTGQSLRMEAEKIALTSNATGLGKDTGITYRAHVQNVGWQAWAKDDNLTGTTGKALQMEAIEVKLYGELANLYDVYYRVHVQDIGWMGWAKNGETAGTTGMTKRIEAMEIKLVEKGKAAPTSSNQATADKSRSSK